MNSVSIRGASGPKKQHVYVGGEAERGRGSWDTFLPAPQSPEASPCLGTRVRVDEQGVLGSGRSEDMRGAELTVPGPRCLLRAGP